MRRILIDNARKKKSEKHGGQRQRVEWHNSIESPVKPTDDLLAIDEAMTRLATGDADVMGLLSILRASVRLTCAGIAIPPVCAGPIARGVERHGSPWRRRRAVRAVRTVGIYAIPTNKMWEVWKR